MKSPLLLAGASVCVSLLSFACGSDDADGDGRTSGSGSTGNGTGGVSLGTGGVNLGTDTGGSSGTGDPNNNISTNGKISGTIRDFKGTAPDRFPDMELMGESNHGAYHRESGVVEQLIGADRKPVYVDVAHTMFTTKANFDMWFNDVAGTNMTQPLELTFTDPDGDGVFTFDNGGQQFFPIDNQLFGNEGRPHNYHFTFELHTAFKYEGGEAFTFTGDDDVWVFINDKLVVDLGGVGSTAVADVFADQLGLTVGEVYDLDFFFAERHVTESNFRIDTSMKLIDIIVK